MKFAQKFRKLCRAQGWTQRSLAEKLGTVSPSTISNWGQGVFSPRIDEIAKVAEVLGVSVQYLIRDDLDEDTADGLTPDERKLLWLAELVGMETALRRVAKGDEADVGQGTSHAVSHAVSRHMAGHEAIRSQGPRSAMLAGGEEAPATPAPAVEEVRDAVVVSDHSVRGRDTTPEAKGKETKKSTRGAGEEALKIARGRRKGEAG